jgi:hypothetical protein
VEAPVSLLEEIRKKEQILKSAGRDIRAEARRKRATFSYCDPERPDIVVIETADGAEQFASPDPKRRVAKRVG